MAFCSNCGSPVPSGSLTCPNCKQAVGSAPIQPGAPPGDNLIACLFDFSFSRFVAIKVIKVLYVLAFVAAAVVYLTMVVGAFAAGTSTGLLTLVVIGPLVAFLIILWARVTLEVLIVLFRIADHTRDIAESRRASAAGAD